jgi:hypothetical protein
MCTCTQLPKTKILTKCAYITVAAQRGVFHHAVKHQTLVASQSEYHVGIPEVWCLTAKWKCRRRALRCPIKNDSRVKPREAERESRRHGAESAKSPPQASYRERYKASGTLETPPLQARRAAIPASAYGGWLGGWLCCRSFSHSRCAPPSIISRFNCHALKSFASNFQHTGLNLHHRSWYRTDYLVFVWRKGKVRNP